MFYPHKNVDYKRKKEAKKEKVVIVVYLFINLQCKPKGRFSNPPTSQSPIVVRHAIEHSNNITNQN